MTRKHCVTKGCDNYEQPAEGLCEACSIIRYADTWNRGISQTRSDETK